MRVTDTGRLYNAGLFRLGVRDGHLRYWSVSKIEEDWELAERVLERSVLEADTEWLKDIAFPVVADFPEKFFARYVACRVDAWGKGDTTEVMIWVK